MRDHRGVLADVEQGFDFCELSRQQHVVRIRHFRTYGEGAGPRVYLGFRKVHQSLERIGRIVRQSNGDGRLPRAVLVFLSYIYVTFLTFKVVEGGHAEVHQYRIALDDSSQQRFTATAHQSTQVYMPFADMAGDGGTHDGVAQLLFRLVQIGLAHSDTGHSRFVCCYGIVQIQLAGCILFVQGLDAVQVAFGLSGLCLVFLQLRTRFVGFGTVLPLVDDKKNLVAADVRAFFK